MPLPRHGGRALTADRAALLFCVVAGLAIYLLSWDQPVYGDAEGYGYRSASWMSDNGLSPIPSGDEKGEQALGHPAAYFWIWALLMRLLGDSLQVAHILPAASDAAALMGAWTLGRTLGGRTAGVWSMAYLLCTPLFLAQAIQPLQDIPFAALCAFSLASYARGARLRASVLCGAAALMREQALLLAASYIVVEVLAGGRKSLGRLPVFSIPFLVMAASLLGNLAVNGYLIIGGYAGEPARLQAGWLQDRIRLFAGHLLAADGRWVLVTAAVAAGLARFSRSRLPAASVLLLLAPSAFWPPTRLAFLAVLAACMLMLVVRAGRLPGPPGLASGLFIAAMIAFHVLIVRFTRDSQLDLYRYMLGAYPVLIAAAFSLVRRACGVRLLHAVGMAAVAAALPASFTPPQTLNPDRNLRGMETCRWLREAAAVAGSTCDSLVTPEAEQLLFTRPGLGYVEEPLPARTLLPGDTLSEGVSYGVMIPPAERPGGAFERLVRLSVPAGSRMDTLATWSDGELELVLLEVSPLQ